MNDAAASPPQLLIVEDDPEILFAVQDTLEEEGYLVTPATSLPASLDKLSEQLFHLILTDLFQVGKQAPLQSIQPLLTYATPTPVGIMTAWPIPEEAAAQAGASFLLRKPFELDDLIHIIQRELSARSRSPRQSHIVEQFFAALRANDWKHLARLCTPDVVILPLKAPAVIDASTTHGLLTLRALLEQRVSTLPGYMIEDVRVYGRPLGVAARYTARWQSRDGIIHHMAGSLHFHFRGERIAQITGAF